ncbi:MAG: D-glycerate dehydrogenase [Halobacteriovoraceae bacterium]|nr:D-glycerate dehydrogenase [Halobacteriovoraceae bacterium]
MPKSKETNIIFITRKIPEVAKKLLYEEGYAIDLWDKEEPPTYEELIQRCQKADGLISMLSDRMDEAFFRACPHLKVIANYAVGVNNIDLEAAAKNNIPIGNTPDVLTEATSDLALGLILNLTRKIVPATQNAKQGEWKKWEPLGFLGMELKNKTLGIIGMGRIGQSLAKKAQNGFGMNIVYSSRSQTKEIDPSFKRKTLKELLQSSDIVSLHTDLNPSTRKLIDHKEFEIMKKHAYLINTSRGEIINQEALVKALQEGLIEGAGLDVTAPEPLPLEHPLFQTPNTLITPHIGSATLEARNLMATLAAKNIIAGLKGLPLPAGL